MLQSAGMQRPRVVRVWEKVEIELFSERPYDNPYADVDVWVTLTGPGCSRRVYGFWDGGNAYRVRILAPAPGEWQWESDSSPHDPGLAGHRGGFTASRWTEEEIAENPCRRGIPRATENGHALEYADGTPCFLLGDTWWAAPTHRFPWRDDDRERPLGPGMAFQDMVRHRKAQGYNCIAIIAAFPNWANDGHPARLVAEDGTAIRAAWEQAGTGSAKDMHNEGGRPFLFPGRVLGYEDVFPDVERINPAYFQAMDRKIDYLNAQGLIPFIEVARRDVSMAWAKYYPWPDSYARYVQYVWARYQAHIAILSPIHFDSPGLSIPSRAYNAAANAVFAKGIPAFGSPLSCNAAGSSLLNFGNAPEAPWLSLHQIGNRRDHDSHWLLTHIYRTADPPRPALNGEPYYAGWPPGTEIAPDSEEADLYCRSGMYGSLLSGGLAGHIYGAVGLWGGDIEPEAPYKAWEALGWRSGDQMRHLRTFALSEGPRYQDLVPDADLVTPNKTGPTEGNRAWAYCAATPDMSLVMVYLEADCPPATVRCLRYGGVYEATWFDPRTGAWHAAGTLRADASCSARLPEPPGKGDWALKMVAVGG
jgi:hypothetical protein